MSEKSEIEVLQDRVADLSERLGKIERHTQYTHEALLRIQGMMPKPIGFRRVLQLTFNVIICAILTLATLWFFFGILLWGAIT
jgi:hypothetical protein